jgi:branched-chain amino acid transport system ATP-binding protein
VEGLLEVDGLGMRFGGLVAVDGVNLEVHPGEVVSIIGPNGAGKTTVFNCISGFYQPTSGSVSLMGEAIDGLPSHGVARRGLVRTFQNVRLFRNMTAVENLLVAQHIRTDTNLFSGLLKLPRFRRLEKEALERAAFWLELVGLRKLANREAGNLAYGQQRRLEIARCMVTGPRLLLLDEPAAGLNPRETAELDELILALRKEHAVSVLLIEHDMKLVMAISDRIYVIDHGRPLAAGTPREIRENPAVIKAYLGEA